jgi:hypothetical protein
MFSPFGKHSLSVFLVGDLDMAMRQGTQKGGIGRKGRLELSGAKQAFDMAMTSSLETFTGFAISI